MNTPENPWRSYNTGDDKPQWWEEIGDETDPVDEVDPEPDFDDLPEQYVPPEPPPYPILAPPTVLGAAGVLAGLGLVLKPSWLANILSIDNLVIMALGVILFIAGAVALLYRLRNPDDDEDYPPPPDNGAVV
jgi:hypothetical protein